MQLNEITSLASVVPLNVAVVALLAVCPIRSAGVVRSVAVHCQPVGAVAELPMVTTTVQVPVVPETNVPAVAPPTNEVPEQVLVERVYVVPRDWNDGEVVLLPLTASVPAIVSLPPFASVTLAAVCAAPGVIVTRVVPVVAV
jgi:hypothetical protein